MKYFFLSDNWTTGRVWEFGGEWNVQAHRRQPNLQKQSLCIQENGETLWLFQAEDAILMLEVKPKADASRTDATRAANPTIGQVVLKRLLTADQVIERLCQEDSFRSLGANLKPSAQPASGSDFLHPSAERTVMNTASQPPLGPSQSTEDLPAVANEVGIQSAVPVSS